LLDSQSQKYPQVFIDLKVLVIAPRSPSTLKIYFSENYLMKALSALALGTACSISLSFVATVQPAAAFTIGYFTDFNELTTAPAAPINQAGFTPVQITDISTFDLNTIDSLLVNESNNSGLSSGLSSRLADIESWVRGGGSFIVHDRFVAATEGVPQSNPFLIGAPSTLVEREFTNGADLDLIPMNNTLVTNGGGPGGAINNLTLDGGNFSNHGFALAGTLPVGATGILSAGPDPNRVAAFSYGLGSGSVYYSTIPLDFYLEGFGPNPLQEAFTTVYSPNVAAYVQSLQEPTPVPEPASVLGVLAVSALGAGSVRKRKQKQTA
jgi:hypothetical protein